jgi:hypothetical protein
MVGLTLGMFSVGALLLLAFISAPQKANTRRDAWSKDESDPSTLPTTDPSLRNPWIYCYAVTPTMDVSVQWECKDLRDEF